MEIQTFLLANDIQRRDGLYNVEAAAFAELKAVPWMKFPVRFTMQSLALLRRENSSGEAPISLRFDLVDEDGKPIGLPRRGVMNGHFQDGQRFIYVKLDITFEFPSIGRYSLDIVADEGQGGVYHYAIDIAGPDGT